MENHLKLEKQWSGILVLIGLHRQSSVYNVGGVVVFIGAALLWYQRYINRLRISDPEAADKELRPSALDM